MQLTIFQFLRTKVKNDAAKIIMDMIILENAKPKVLPKTFILCDDVEGRKNFNSLHQDDLITQHIMSIKNHKQNGCYSHIIDYLEARFHKKDNEKCKRTYKFEKCTHNQWLYRNYKRGRNVDRIQYLKQTLHKKEIRNYHVELYTDSKMFHQNIKHPKIFRKIFRLKRTLLRTLLFSNIRDIETDPRNLTCERVKKDINKQYDRYVLQGFDFKYKCYSFNHYQTIEQDDI